jgi:hypothetical protein
MKMKMRILMICVPYQILLGADLLSQNSVLTLDWTTGVRSPTEAKDFSSSLRVQSSSEAHPASYPMGTGGPFPGVKRGPGVTLTTHPHLVPRSRMSRSFISSPLSACMAVADSFNYFTFPDFIRVFP